MKQLLVIWVVAAFLFLVALILRDSIDLLQANLKARLQARHRRRLDAMRDRNGRSPPAGRV
jgi:hypothetical protein